MRARWAFVGLATLLGCTERPPPGSGSAPALVGPSATATGPVLPSGSVAPEARVRQLRGAELARQGAAVREEDLAHRSVAVRRAAARAAARIADSTSAPLLARALADEDREVVAWAAHGLGAVCAGRERETVRRLVARSASLEKPERPDPGALPGAEDPARAIAGALARCGTREAEITLRAWLRAPPPRGDLGAIGLGMLAFRRGRLDDATVIALLDRAASTESPIDHALLAFAHLDDLSESVRERLVAVATPALTTAGRRRALAIRALGSGGAAAAAPLARALGDVAVPPAERAEAARQLGRLGAEGQAALGGALGPIVKAAVDAPSLVAPSFAPLVAALDALTEPVPAAREALERLAEVPLRDGMAPAEHRRAVWLRCAAASILAGAATLSQRLVACDPTPGGRTGALFTTRVLDRGVLTRSRQRRWLDLALGADPVVAEAALGLMARHPEIPAAHTTLARALGSKHGGVVAAAATVLAAFPDRAAAAKPAEREQAAPDPLAARDAPAPDPVVVTALTAAFARPATPGTFEPRLSLLDAAGALGVLSLKPQLETACTSDNPALRVHAERALRRLGERRRICASAGGDPAAAPATEGAIGGFELTVVTDAGRLRLTLDAAPAPLAVARVVELARRGFYAGTVVHRVVPGFVVQLGDPGGDGFGGADAPPLRCETAPIPFDAHAVGMALSGKDTGSSQFFVTLGSYPHLEGEYTRIGTASGDWDRVAVGDVIERIEVRPLGTP